MANFSAAAYFAAARDAHDDVAEKTYLEQQARQAPPPEKTWEEREREKAVELFTRDSFRDQVNNAIQGRPTETQRQRRKTGKWGK
jgi:hypothetical protein